MSFEFAKKQHTDPGSEVEIFEAYLKSQGLKLTNARRGLLSLIFSDHSHFTADELYDRCRSENVPVSKATLYRTLTILLDCKLLAAHDFGEDAKYYEHIHGHRHHDHMYCVVCSQVLEFHSDSIESLQDEAAQEAGFRSLRHSLTIFGVCAVCSTTDRGREILSQKDP